VDEPRFLDDASAKKEAIDALIDGLLADTNVDFPVVSDAFVQTFLYRCDWYKLPMERLASLGAYAVSRGSETFLIRRSFEPFAFERLDPTMELLAFPPDEVLDGTSMDEETMGWRRVPQNLWWEGSWLFTEVREHVMVDAVGQWAVVISDMDYGYLVADRETSAGILATWGIAAADDLARYTDDLASGLISDVPFGRRALAHARARLEVDALVSGGRILLWRTMINCWGGRWSPTSARDPLRPGGVETRHFSGGTKVWILPAKWGSDDDLVVVGKHRGTRRRVRIVASGGLHGLATATAVHARGSRRRR
jgi:hypothetical protein